MIVTMCTCTIQLIDFYKHYITIMICDRYIYTNFALIFKETSFGKYVFQASGLTGESHSVVSSISANVNYFFFFILFFIYFLLPSFMSYLSLNCSFKSFTPYVIRRCSL